MLSEGGTRKLASKLTSKLAIYAFPQKRFWGERTSKSKNVKVKAIAGIGLRGMALPLGELAKKRKF